jgi:hypothetical protein
MLLILRRNIILAIHDQPRCKNRGNKFFIKFLDNVSPDTGPVKKLSAQNRGKLTVVNKVASE